MNNVYLNGVRIAAVLADTQAIYYLTDQVDSVKAVLNDSGMIVTSHEYKPFGEDWVTEGDTKNAPKYNSQELDRETGYYFYNARHYDPEIGRFVTADTVVPRENDTRSWNRFAYASNNPIIYKDPTGHRDIGGLGKVIDTVENLVTQTAKESVDLITHESDIGNKIANVLTKVSSRLGNVLKIANPIISCASLITLTGDSASSQADIENRYWKDYRKKYNIDQSNSEDEKKRKTVYHGTRDNLQDILLSGLSTNPKKLPAYVSSDREAAKDVIFNNYDVKCGNIDPKKNAGIVASDIPQDIWDVLKERGSIKERTYHGFSGQMNTVEYQLKDKAAVEAFNAWSRLDTEYRRKQK